MSAWLNQLGKDAQSVGSLYIHFLLGMFVLVTLVGLYGLYYTYDYRYGWVNLNGKVKNVSCEKGSLITTTRTNDDETTEETNQTWNCDTTVTVNVDGKQETHQVKTVETHDASKDHAPTINLTYNGKNISTLAEPINKSGRYFAWSMVTFLGVFGFGFNWLMRNNKTYQTVEAASLAASTIKHSF